MVLAQVPGTDAVREVAELFGGGPIAAAFALLVVAVVALFVMLVRSHRAHVKLAISVVEAGVKQTAIVQRNTEVLEEAVAVLDEALTLARGRESAPRRRVRAGRGERDEPGQEGGP